jgi:excisionase family DNA binding protein
MTNRDNNLTASFAEYLKIASNIEEISDNNITMSIYGALNDMDSGEDTIRLIYKMIIDYEHIVNVLTPIVNNMEKSRKIENINRNKNADDIKITPQEMACQFGISEQAIRKACREKRIPFEKGTGKIKYLIKKEDAMKYMQSAKGKNYKNVA